MNKIYSKVQNPQKKAETSMTSHSVSKIDLKILNPGVLVRNEEARIYLNSVAKMMLDDMKEFSASSVEIFNKTNATITQEFHLFLKNSCKKYFNFSLADHKRKIDTLVTDHSERMRKMELLKTTRERFITSGNN